MSERCAICLQCQKDDLFTFTPCQHNFHKTCIYQYSITHLFNHWDRNEEVKPLPCPLCRQELKVKGPEEACVMVDELRNLVKVRDLFNRRLSHYLTKRGMEVEKMPTHRVTTREIRDFALFGAQTEDGMIVDLGRG